jgi:hypothetical protein
MTRGLIGVEAFHMLSLRSSCLMAAKSLSSSPLPRPLQAILSFYPHIGGTCSKCNGAIPARALDMSLTILLLMSTWSVGHYLKLLQYSRANGQDLSPSPLYTTSMVNFMDKIGLNHFGRVHGAI